MSNLVIIVVAYDDKVRETLVASLARFAVTPVSCATFCEAESHLLAGRCQGIMVDLPTIIKAKGEEKVVAFTLTSFFPTLRIKTMGNMLVPMTMPGDAKQDKSLSDFLSKTCAEFHPRGLRLHKRRQICIPPMISSPGSLAEPTRGFTQNISWGGAFIADMNPERFEIGAEISLTFPGFQSTVEVIVVRIVQWGGHKVPGIGVKFLNMTDELKSYLTELLRSSQDADRDRITS